MRLLRESIIDELKLVDSVKYEDLSLSNHHFSDEAQVKLTGDNVYNLGRINNEEAIGYNRLKERAANPDENWSIAHDNVFDQMLAEYFLQKRGEVKASNKLVQDFANKFENDGKNLNPLVKNESGGDRTLGEHYARMTWDKDDQPELPPYNLEALMDLDIAINKQLHNKRGFLSQELKQLDNLDVDIPDFFDLNDVRKPVDLYVKDKLTKIVEELFEARNKVEKYMSRQELLAYDQVMMSYLSHENLLPKLRREIYKDFNQFEQQSQMVNHALESEESIGKQFGKTRNKQEIFNRDVQDEDSYFKMLAYAGMLEKRRRNRRKETLDDMSIFAGFEAFDQWYIDHLLQQAKQKPRPIDHEALKYKSPLQRAAHGRFMTPEEKG